MTPKEKKIRLYSVQCWDLVMLKGRTTMDYLVIALSKEGAIEALKRVRQNSSRHRAVELNPVIASEILSKFVKNEERCNKCGAILAPISYCCLNCEWTWDDTDSISGYPEPARPDRRDTNE